MNNFSLSTATVNLSSDAAMLADHCQTVQQTILEAMTKDFESNEEIELPLDEFLVDLYNKLDLDKGFSLAEMTYYLPLNYNLIQLNEGHQDCRGINEELFRANVSLVETLWTSLNNMHRLITKADKKQMDTRRNEKVLAQDGNYTGQLAAVAGLLESLSYRSCPTVRLCEAVQRVTHKAPKFERTMCGSDGSVVQCAVTLGEITIIEDGAGSNTKEARSKASEKMIGELFSLSKSKTAKVVSLPQLPTPPPGPVRPEISVPARDPSELSALIEELQRYVYGVFVDGERKGYSFTAANKTFTCDHIFGLHTATDVRQRRCHNQGYKITDWDEELSNFSDDDTFIINNDVPVLRIFNRFYTDTRAAGYSGSPVFRIHNSEVSVIGVLLGGLHSSAPDSYFYELSIAFFENQAGDVTTQRIIHDAELWAGNRRRSNSTSAAHIPRGQIIIYNSSRSRQPQPRGRSQSRSTGNVTRSFSESRNVAQHFGDRSASMSIRDVSQSRQRSSSKARNNKLKNQPPNNQRPVSKTRNRSRSRDRFGDQSPRRQRRLSSSARNPDNSRYEEKYHIPPFKGKKKKKILTKATITHNEFLSTGAAIAGTLRHSDEIGTDGYMTVKAVCKKHKITVGVLNEIVKENSKQRFQLSKDGLKIRCLHGHSVPVDPQKMGYGTLKEGILYHVTGSTNVNSILQGGLKKYGRQFLHFVGPAMISTVKRKNGRYIMCQIEDLLSAGLTVFVAENGIVLVKGDVPRELIRSVHSNHELPEYHQVTPIVKNTTAVIKKKVTIDDAPRVEKKKKHLVSDKVDMTKDDEARISDSGTAEVKKNFLASETGADWATQVNNQAEELKKRVVAPSAPLAEEVAAGLPTDRKIYPPLDPPDYEHALRSDQNIVPFVDDHGKEVGYGTIVGGYLYKPKHVVGTMKRHVTIEPWEDLGARSLDLQRAKVVARDAGYAAAVDPLKHTKLMLIDNTEVTYKSKRYYVAERKPGLSGSPVLGSFDGTKHVVGILIGGKPTKDNHYKLGIVTFSGKDSTTSDEYSATEVIPWSSNKPTSALKLIEMLLLSLVVCFAVEKPEYSNVPMAQCLSAHITKNGMSFANLATVGDDWSRGDYLRQNTAVDNKPGECKPNGHGTTDAEAWKAGLSSQAIASPFLDKCENCGVGPCVSPVAIKEVQFDEGGNMRVKISASMGRLMTPYETSTQVFATTDHGTTSYRKKNGKLGIAKVLPEFYVDDNLCSLIKFAGYYAVLQCHPGRVLRVELRVTEKLVCEHTFISPSVKLFEESPIWVKHEYSKPCTLFQTRPGPSNKEYHTVVSSVSFAQIPVEELLNVPSPMVQIDGGKVSIKRSLRYLDWTVKAVMSCSETPDPVTLKSSHNSTVFGRCNDAVIRTLSFNTEGSLQGLSGLYRFVNSTVVELPQPFAKYKGKCHYTVAALPEIVVADGRVVITSNTSYPVRLMLFQNDTVVDRWIGPYGSYVSNVTDGRFSFVWGNNIKQERWALTRTMKSPHGGVVVQFAYYYQHRPVATMALTVFVAALSILTVIMSAVIIVVLRSYILRSPRTKNFPWAVLILLCLLPRCRSYEHNVLLSANVKASAYHGVITKDGYEPINITISVTSTSVTPSLTIDYETCSYSVEAAPAKVSCCESQSCAPDTNEYKCEVFSGVYPYVWGAASCFCSSENSQKSEAIVKLSDDCSVDNATAYKTSTSNDKVVIKLTINDITEHLEARVDGQTASIINNDKVGKIAVVVGPMSTPISPFDRKIVEYKGKVYNYDFPEYGASVPGAFGDVQKSVGTDEGLIINSEVVFLRPNNDDVVNRVVAGKSGFSNWQMDMPLDVTTENNFGCVISTHPIKASNCSMGFVPVSVNVPDGMFSRKVKVDTIDTADCSPIHCTFGTIGAGMLKLNVATSHSANCLLQPKTDNMALHTSYLPIGAGNSEHYVNYSTVQHTLDVDIKICNLVVTCQAECEPPRPHVYNTPVLLEKHESGNLTPAAIRSLASFIVPLVAGVIILIGILVTYRICRPKQKTLLSPITIRAMTRERLPIPDSAA